MGEKKSKSWGKKMVLGRVIVIVIGAVIGAFFGYVFGNNIEQLPEISATLQAGLLALGISGVNMPVLLAAAGLVAGALLGILVSLAIFLIARSNTFKNSV